MGVGGQQYHRSYHKGHLVDEKPATGKGSKALSCSTKEPDGGRRYVQQGFRPKF